MIFILWHSVNQTPRDAKIVPLVNEIFEKLPELVTDVFPVQDMLKLGRRLADECGQGHSLLPHVHHRHIAELVDVMVGRKNPAVFNFVSGSASSTIDAQTRIATVFSKWRAAYPSGIGANAHDKMMRIETSHVNYVGMSHGGLGATTYTVNYDRPKAP